MLSGLSLDGCWKEGLSDGKRVSTVEKNFHVGTTMQLAEEKCYGVGAPNVQKAEVYKDMAQEHLPMVLLGR